MKSLADALPPEIARQIHPDWRKNEAAYWAVRDQLIRQYQGQWIGFADGAVIASGPVRLPCSTWPRHRGGIRLSPALGARTSRPGCAGPALPTIPPTPENRCQSST